MEAESCSHKPHVLLCSSHQDTAIQVWGKDQWEWVNLELTDLAQEEVLVVFDDPMQPHHPCRISAEHAMEASSVDLIPLLLPILSRPLFALCHHRSFQPQPGSSPPLQIHKVCQIPIQG